MVRTKNEAIVFEVILCVPKFVENAL